jgi:hypothetical protein
MSQILETLAPLALLIALGSARAHIKFLGATKEKAFTKFPNFPKLTKF